MSEPHDAEKTVNRYRAALAAFEAQTTDAGRALFRSTLKRLRAEWKAQMGEDSVPGWSRRK